MKRLSGFHCGNFLLPVNTHVSLWGVTNSKHSEKICWYQQQVHNYYWCSGIKGLIPVGNDCHLQLPPPPPTPSPTFSKLVARLFDLAAIQAIFSHQNASSICHAVGIIIFHIATVSIIIYTFPSPSTNTSRFIFLHKNKKSSIEYCKPPVPDMAELWNLSVWTALKDPPSIQHTNTSRTIRMHPHVTLATHTQCHARALWAIFQSSIKNSSTIILYDHLHTQWPLFWSGCFLYAQARWVSSKVVYNGSVTKPRPVSTWETWIKTPPSQTHMIHTMTKVSDSAWYR